MASRRASVKVVALAATVACASGSGAVAPAWRLVWSDEFDGASGSQIDTTHWRYDIGDGCASSNCGWGNNEKEDYTSDTSKITLKGQGQLRNVARVGPA